MKHYEPIRNYETTVIFRPTLNETDLQTQIETVKNTIESAGGTILKQDVWGRRRLAYPIDGHSEGVYVFWFFRGEPKTVAELNRRYQINENVLRSLTIRCAYSLEDAPPISLDEAESEETRSEEERKPKHPRRTRDEEPEPSSEESHVDPDIEEDEDGEEDADFDDE